jgi:hypothetical protein
MARRYRIGAVGNDKVRAAVVVEVRDRNAVRRTADAERGLPYERAVARPDVHGDRITPDVADDQVELAVAVQIGSDHGRGNPP